MVSFRSLLSGTALVLAGAFVFPGCSKQGEAMRCEQNSDCESGLTCVGGATGIAGPVGINDSVCCPDDKAAASTEECRRPRGGSVTDGGTSETGTDTGTVSEGGSSDAATDAVTESGGDSGAVDADTDSTTSDAADAD